MSDFYFFPLLPRLNLQPIIIIMKTSSLSFLFLLFLSPASFSQSYTAAIEPCPCMVKYDARLVARCGYLVAPENRQRPQGKSVKVPFVYLRKPEADASGNVTLFSTGGPGYSTIAGFDSIRYESDFFKFGGLILFNQRGAKRSQPCLDCAGIDEAIKRSYKENLSRDSLVMEVVTRCRKGFESQGIDLSAYNTIESAEDINDLRKTLGIDSLNLLGISYSGGLMLTVARNHPEAVRLLLLNSPLPGYVHFEEDGLLNFNEALNQVFTNCETDSARKDLYGDLRRRFHTYFSGLSGKAFTLSYTEPSGTETLRIRYTRNELLDAVSSRLNPGQLASLPFVMNELIAGHHEPYIKEVLDGHFQGNSKLSYGMRLSIYCSEQIAYADPALIKKQDAVVPWLAGYPFNNVNHAICSCWKVKPEAREAKTPVYSRVPVLVSGGDVDPDCRPFYNRLIKRTMPNAQLLIIHNRGHLSGFYVNGEDFGSMFLADPYKKIVSRSKDVIVE